jgi:hypothetical protein
MEKVTFGILIFSLIVRKFIVGMLKSLNFGQKICQPPTSGFAKWRHYLALTIFHIFAARTRVEKALEAATSRSRRTLGVILGHVKKRNEK